VSGSDSSGEDQTETVAAAQGVIGSVAERAAGALTQQLTRPLAPGLYIVATPIGNLADVTLRALAVLAQADVIYCEDTRHSRTLMQHYAISTRLKPYHEHNAETERPHILAGLERGQRIALISDAGTPLISDPGFKLVRQAAELGYPVVSLPGPSAVMAALTSAGLPTDAFLFAGFLPSKQMARRARLSELAQVPSSLVFFESPQRAPECLADMALVLGSRPACMARELTKLHEDVRRGTLADLAANVAIETLKGEIVIVAGPPLATQATDADISEKLAKALESMSLKDAAKAVSESFGISKARVYDLGLQIKDASRRP
jgi:16S rRNA (cytidine1402-2'-O)-methyltransferase